MQRNVYIFTIGFVVGIALARSYMLVIPPLPYVILAAGILVLIALINYLKGTSNTVILFSAALVIGAALFVYHKTPSGDQHIVQYASDQAFKDKTTIIGYIHQEPEVRERYTYVILKPESLTKGRGSDTVSITSGLIRVKMYPSVGPVYDRLAYGDRIKIVGTLTRPAVPTNPGQMDIRTSLENFGIYATMTARQRYEIERLDQSGGAWMVDLSLYIKHHILMTIKKTVPYPESTFLGGVLLGLRSGLSKETQDNFRSAGVSHVLAVSGLHVSIITALFMALFALFHVPRRVSGPIIIFCLIIFTIITGARPSSVRAAIMNSIAVLLFYVLEISLRTSILFSISISALVILAFNPLLISEAAFLFSFAAVISLGLLTTPIEKLLMRRIKSLTAYAVMFFFIVTLGFFIFDLDFITHPPIGFIVFAAFIPLAYLLDRLLPYRITFRSMPFWVRSFLCAQFAIQLGMAPLSVLYFSRMSLSAPMANFIAIPLIGVIVQLGMLAGIIDFIPIIGLPIALVLNAFNWLCIKAFLGTASFWAKIIPYPWIQQPPTWFLWLYYLALALFIWGDAITGKIRQFYIQFHNAFQTFPGIRIRTYICCFTIIIAILCVGASLATPLLETRLFEMLLFDPTVFNLGGGNPMLITTPQNKHILLDGCPSEVLMGDRWIPFNLGEVLLLPVLLKKNITTLDYVILTNPDPNRTGGLTTLFQNIAVKNFIESTDYIIDEEQQCTKLTDYLADSSLAEAKNADFTAKLCANYFNLRKLIAEKSINRILATDGQILYEEKNGAHSFIIKAMLPFAEREIQPYALSTYSLILKIEYGNFKALVCPALTNASEKALIERYSNELDCSLLLPASFGFVAKMQSDPFLELTSPDWVVFQYRSQRETSRNFKKIYDRYCRTTKICFRTDRNGSVLIMSDGDSTDVTPTIASQKKGVK